MVTHLIQKASINDTYGYLESDPLRQLSIIEVTAGKYAGKYLTDALPSLYPHEISTPFRAYKIIALPPGENEGLVRRVTDQKILRTIAAQEHQNLETYAALFPFIER